MLKKLNRSYKKRLKEQKPKLHFAINAGVSLIEFKISNWFIPFLTNVSILYHLKTGEKLGSSGAFMEHKIGTMVRIGLKRGT